MRSTPSAVVRVVLCGSLLVSAAGAFAPSAAGSTIVYNSQSSFLAAVSNPGTDTFNDMPNAVVSSPINRTAGSYSYSGSVSTTSFFPAGGGGDVWLSTNTATDSITFNSFSSGVTAIGGFFFGTDIGGALLPGTSINVTIVDAFGTPTQLLTNTTTSTFLGFLSSNPITSLTVSAVQPLSGFAWPTVNDLTLATTLDTAPAVPEPASLTLLGLGLAGMGARRWRQRKP